MYDGNGQVYAPLWACLWPNSDRTGAWRYLEGQKIKLGFTPSFLNYNQQPSGPQGNKINKQMKKLLFLLLTLGTYWLPAQTIQTLRTYYDPLAKSVIHEEWQALTEPPFKKHGRYREWDSDGVLLREMNYKNGKLNGESRFYVFVADYTQRKCYGKLLGVSNHLEGEKHGTQQDYHCYDGELVLVKEEEFIKGESISLKRFTSQGKPIASLKKTGLNKEWYENGNLKLEYEMADHMDHGMFKQYHPNGQIAIQGQFLNGKETGEWRRYDENGKLIDTKSF
mgnify:CR=1 FL=1